MTDTPEFKMPVACLREEYPSHNERMRLCDEIVADFERDNLKPWERKVGVYHPSALTRCRRACYYDVTSVPPKPRHDAGLLALFSIGHALHDMLQKRLAEMFDDFESEVEVTIPPLNVYGHTDGVLRQREYVVEIKTVGDATYKKLVRPKKDHVIQVHCYMYALNIPRCYMLYINRNTGEMRGFVVRFRHAIWEEALTVIRYVEHYVKAETPPPREINKWTCRSCKFFHVCKPVL
jgi:CRISPR/Cas system-associated exonuclease Cas4 (RecB family)